LWRQKTVLDNDDMKTPFQNLVDEVKALNVKNASMVDASVIQYSKEFRQLCAQNKCGYYGKNWMCPPAVGTFDDLKEKASRYKWGLIFQTVHKLSKRFDFEGMNEAARIHEKIARKVQNLILDRAGTKEVLPLGAGPCKFCATCTYLDGEACRFPDKAMASVESYGIDVAALLKACGMPYHNGKETVSYVGCILFSNRFLNNQ
jgi:predicted metal-binding protein